MKGESIKDKNLRLKYVRALERFIRSNISYLKEEDFDFEIFCSRVERTYEILQKAEATRLNATYPMALEKYANRVLDSLHVKKSSQEEQEAFKEELLKEANLLHKEKNRAKYKKEKYKSKSFNDGY